MMKKILLLLFSLLSVNFAFAQTKNIEFEPRVGISCLTEYNGRGANIGYNIGGMVSVLITERFYINPGMSFFSTKLSNENIGALQVPIYASYRIPIKESLLHLNAGPYAVLGAYDFGLSAEIGIEYKKWYGAINTYQSLLIGEMTGIFGLSLGYKFSLHK